MRKGKKQTILKRSTLLRFTLHYPKLAFILLGIIGGIVWYFSGPYRWNYYRFSFENGSTNDRMNAESFFLRQGEKGTNYLIQCLKYPDPQVRTLSAHGLGTQREPKAVDELLDRLGDEIEDRSVIEAATVALGRIGDYRAGPALISALDNEWPMVRFFSALSLIRITGKEIGVDRFKWEEWWNSQENLIPIPQRKRPKGSIFLLSENEKVRNHFYKAVLGPAQNAVPSITTPIWVSPSDRRILHLLNDRTRVYGLPLKSPFRPLAIPANILDRHQVINLKIKNRPAVIFGCPLGNYATAYFTESDGWKFTFGASGYLCNSSMVPYDHQTESFWNPLDGIALLGHSKGLQLESLPLVQCNWGVWKKRFPNTLVLSPNSYKKGIFYQEYHDPAYPGFPKNEFLYSPLIHSDDKKQMPQKEKIIGLHKGKECKSYLISEIENVGGLVSDRFSGQEIFIQWNQKENLAVVRNKNGEFLPAVMTFWFVWNGYHPETRIVRFKHSTN